MFLCCGTVQKADREAASSPRNCPCNSAAPARRESHRTSSSSRRPPMPLPQPIPCTLLSDVLDERVDHPCTRIRSQKFEEQSFCIIFLEESGAITLVGLNEKSKHQPNLDIFRGCSLNSRSFNFQAGIRNPAIYVFQSIVHLSFYSLPTYMVPFEPTCYLDATSWIPYDKQPMEACL